MNIQIFGTKKCQDTRKAERFFKERGIKYQFVDTREKGLSRGELLSVIGAVKKADLLIDTNSRDTGTVALLEYLSDSDKIEKILKNQHILKTPIVRNGREATVGYAPEIWKSWK